MRSWKVGIIGGGPGGLMTAYFLQNTANAPLDITLFEASDRLGGKILTPKFEARGASYEAGAAEFYDYSPVGEDPLKELIADLGLSINPLGGSAVIINQRVLANLDDIRGDLGEEAFGDLLKFDRAAKDWMSPREYYAADHIDTAAEKHAGPYFDSVLKTIASPKLRHFIECMIHSDLATEPERTSVAYGLQNYLMNDPRYMQLYGIEGGNRRLTDELARRIDAKKLLNHRVTEVGRNQAKQLTIQSVHAGSVREDAFDFVVVALPNNYLPTLRFANERLAKAVVAHHKHYDHPAHYLRMSLLFDRPFWRSKVKDSFFMLDRFGGCCLYDETSREPGVDYGVLGWLLGGQVALDMSQLSDEVLIEKALESLPNEWAESRQFFLEGRVHRWENAVNAIPGGLTPRSMDKRHQPEPVENPDLFVVGDYLFDSTLNGVFDSAEYVAEWLAAEMFER